MTTSDPRETGPAVDLSGDLCLLLADAVTTYADAPAVLDDSHELTYAQLWAAAGRMADDLASAGVRTGDVVVVDVPRSALEVVAVLGVLRAGAAYTSLDPAAPEARLAQMLERCRPRAVVAGRPRSARLAELAGDGCLLHVPTSLSDGTAADERPASAPLAPDHPAYVAFTSGSTGGPKAVVVPHRAVVRLVRGSGHYLTAGPGHRLLRLAPLAFDASTLEVFAGLGRGSCLVVHPEGPVAPLELAAFLDKHAVTHAWLTAGLFRLVAKEAPAAFDGLTQVLTGGDVVPAETVREVLARRPGLAVTNGYGPTENTTFTATYTVRDPADLEHDVPIGHPVGGTTALVLDAELRRVPDGEPGELCVGGSGLALGYAGDADATARAFVSSPELPGTVYRTGDLVLRDERGRLRFLGRLDRQVKIRGHRVELGEIESALRALDGVRDAAVVWGEVGTREPALVAALVGDGSGVREALGVTLPDYMLPAVVVEVDALPLTANGKVDTERVLRLAERPEPASAPADLATLEARVTALWVEVLGHDDFESDEGFFEVGGDSLLAASLHTRLTEVFPAAGIRVVDLFRCPTVEAFAAFLRDKETV